MVRSCSLKNCNNSVKQKYRFFLLPSVKKVAKRSAWLKKCGHLLPERLPEHGNSISLCEGHFEPDQFVEYGPNIRTILKPTAVPTIFTRNPPRVCDKIASMYVEILEENIQEEGVGIEEFGEQNIISTEEELILHKGSSDPDKKIQKIPEVTSDEVLSIDLPKSPTKLHAVDIKNPPPIVQLLQIKKNRLVMSTRSDEVNATPIKEAVSNNKRPLSANEVKSESTSFILYNNDQIKKVETIGEPTPKLTSSPGNNKVKIISQESPILMRVIDSSSKTHNNVKSSDQNENNSLPITRLKNMNENLRLKNTDVPITYSRLSMDTVALRKQVHDLEVERDNAIRKYRQMALRLETFESNLRLFLNDDQIRLLESESPPLNTVSWSAETLQKSAKIRCIVGPRAYEYLRSHEHYPLPSFRTLYRHRNISKINEYTHEMIQDHMNSTINEVSAMGADDSEGSDIEFEDEHIKIEMLEPDYENSMDSQNESIIVGNHEILIEPKEIAGMSEMEYITDEIVTTESLIES